MTIEETLNVDYLNKNSECKFNLDNINLNKNDFYFARVLFCYKSERKETYGLDLKAGDLVEIFDNLYDKEEWKKGRVLSSFQKNYPPSLKAIMNALNNSNRNIKQYYLQSSRMKPIKIERDNFLFENTELYVNFEIEANESAGNKTMQPVLYEELCIFDPIMQYHQKRPIAFFFAIDNKLVTSFNLNTMNCEFSQKNEHFNRFAEFILEIIKNSNDQYILPNLYSIEPSLHGTPLLTRKNNRNYLNRNPMFRLVEESTQRFIAKNEWDSEYEKFNINSSVFDEKIGYQLIEIWLDFLTNSQQLFLFPSFENFNFFRNSTPFGKICFYVLINFNFGQTKLPNIYTFNRNKKTIFTQSKYSLNNIKHVFDAFHETSSQSFDEILNEIKKYIHEINHSPSFVIK